MFSLAFNLPTCLIRSMTRTALNAETVRGRKSSFFVPNRLLEDCMRLLYGTKISSARGEAQVQQKSMKHDSDPEDESRRLSPLPHKFRTNVGNVALPRTALQKKPLRKVT